MGAPISPSPTNPARGRVCSAPEGGTAEVVALFMFNLWGTGGAWGAGLRTNPGAAPQGAAPKVQGLLFGVLHEHQVAAVGFGSEERGDKGDCGQDQ